MTAALDEVLERDHLAANEAARDVRVDRRRRLERGLTAAQSPGARLLVAPREERQQAGFVEERRDCSLECRLALAEGRSLVGAELGELAFQLEIETALAVDDAEQRLGRKRLELGRDLVGIVGQ